MNKKELLLQEITKTIAFHQPKLRIICVSPSIVIEGGFLLTGKGYGKRIDEYDVRIIADYRYPQKEPKVFEMSGRIPRNADHHINNDGSCCIGVWEQWLITSDNNSFSQFIKGPLHQYFLSQWCFEKKGKWPFGERSHGEKGVLEACSEIVGIPSKKEPIIRYLKTLSLKEKQGCWPKGHWLCPCGSGYIIRKCASDHAENLKSLHKKIPPRNARALLKQFPKHFSSTFLPV